MYIQGEVMVAFKTFSHKNFDNFISGKQKKVVLTEEGKNLMSYPFS